jgi:hypothetical protein
MDLRGLDMMVKGLRDGDGFNDKVRDDLLIKYLMAGHQRRAFFSYLMYKRCAREGERCCRTTDAAHRERKHVGIETSNIQKNSPRRFLYSFRA